MGAIMKAMRSIALLALFPLFISAQAGLSPALQTKRVSFHSTADGTTQYYGLYVPRDLDPAAKLPLIVILHAEESSELASVAQFFAVPGSPGIPSVSPGYGPRPTQWNAIIAAPSGRGTMGFAGIAEQDVYDVLDEVRTRYSVDQDRIYLIGLSMGGGAALRLALTRPDVWAAVVAFCPASQGGEEFAPNALNLPIRIYQGEIDPLVPAASSRAWQKRLLETGSTVEYFEYPEVRHNAWNIAFRDRGFQPWLLSHRRNPNPERVRLVTRSYRYGSAYWLRIDGLTPGTPASVDARRLSAAEMRVDTSNVDGLSIASAALELPGAVIIDGDTVRLKAGAALSFVRSDGHWSAGSYTPQGKRPGLEGPISAVVSTGHIYVYGTADNPPESELKSRRRVAQEAASWSSDRARTSLELPVKADSELSRAELEDANLVLLGTRETNSVIRRFEKELPLALAPGAADYGLLFVAPQGKRLLLVSSGVPWWTGAGAAARSKYQFVPPRFAVLSSFGDFVLLKGSLDDVVIEGCFDRNWKLPADLSAKLLATGTVSIQK